MDMSQSEAPAISLDSSCRSPPPGSTLSPGAATSLCVSPSKLYGHCCPDVWLASLYWMSVMNGLPILALSALGTGDNQRRPFLCYGLSLF